MRRLCCLTIFCIFYGLVSGKSPNILFIVADDLGWNDVGFRNPDIISPNIDRLAKEGVILNQSYVQPVCTPSRNAFMSGIYPFKAGLQHGAIMPQQPVCAPLNRTYLPQKLKEIGYTTHMIGKWHLGMCNWKCTPTYRGFDSFFGFYNGQEDYYNYTILGGNDFRYNKEPIKPEQMYSTYLYARRAQQLIDEHDKDKPLFLYMAFQSVHAPIQVPKVYEDMYKNIKNQGRRQFSGMVTAMDDAIGKIITALKQKGIYDDTLIIFTADNGGWPTFYGNNYPLRGSKITVYEGGTRASAFVHGSMLKNRGYTYDGLIHAVDWMPTMISAAGGSPVTDIDGVDQWPAIVQGSQSKRNEFIYNLDNMFPAVNGHAAIRSGDYKLIDGFPGPYPFWYKPQQYEKDEPIQRCHLSKQQHHLKNHKYKDHVYEPYEYQKHENEEIIGMCNETFGFYQLFNLKDDPNEYYNLAFREPHKVMELKNKLDIYKKSMVPANFPKNDPNSKPEYFDGYWSPGWC